MFSKHDVEILRKVALQVKEAAARDNSQEKIAFWTRHTALKGERPAIQVYPIDTYWEMPEMTLECEDPYAREVEHQLRRVVFHSRYIPDDMPILDTVTVDKAYTNTMWGAKPKQEYTGGTGRGAYKHVPIIEDPDDWGKLSKPVITYQPEQTKERWESVGEAIGHILTPQLEGERRFHIHFMNWYCAYRGLDNMLYDLYDEPEMVHDVMKFFTEGSISMYRQLEEQNLISLNNNMAFHYTGGIGFNEELPGEDFDPNHVKLKNCWGAAEAQETDVVSPEMHEEFVLQYERQVLELFGLNGYGCCDNLAKKLDNVLKIKNLRRVAVCPWADTGEFLPVLKDRYIMTWKPQPSYLSMAEFGREAIEQELSSGIRKARGGRLELILRDLTSVRGDPERITQWVQIARKAIAENWY